MEDARKLIESIGVDEDAVVVALADAMYGLEGATDEQSWTYYEDAEDVLLKLRERGFDVVRVSDP